MEQQQQQHANNSAQPQMEGLESEGMGMDNASTLQLKQLQAGIGNSSQVQQLKSIQMRLNQSPMQQMALQRKEGLSANAAAATADKGGLPDNLRTGIEQMSGMDMSDVKVHRNSSKAAEAGALAYAQGNDIHLGPGQEQHLAHEAWHVVQQRQGRVQATTESANGLPVNDDKSLESEADSMGAKAMQMKMDGKQSVQLKGGKAGGALQRKATSGGIIQRVVTEVVPKLEKKKEENKEKNLKEKEKNLQNSDDMEDEIIETSKSNSEKNESLEEKNKEDNTEREIVGIKSVNVVGRPASPYSGTMGDHSTAFVVHKEGLKTQLVGKTFEEGFEVINSHYNAIQTLPGWKLIDNLPEKHKERVQNAIKALEKLLKTDAEVVEASVVINLQKAINEYLELRELLPLSTINTKAKYPSLTGKGKGESSRVKPIVESMDKEEAPEGIYDHILGLFDFQAASICIVEMDLEKRTKLLPGVSVDAKPNHIFEAFLEQHIASMLISFPHLETKGFVERKVLKEKMIQQLLPDVEEMVILACYSYIEHVNSYNRKKVGTGLSENYDEEELQKRRVNLESELKNVLLLESLPKELLGNGAKSIGIAKNMVWATDNLVKGKRVPKKVIKMGSKQEEKKLKEERKLKEEQKEKEKLKKGVNKKKAKFETQDSEDSNSNSVQLGESGKKKEFELKKMEDLENEEYEEEKGSSLALQVDLDEDEKICALEFAGRTPSPFPNTMGAHTIAWILHLDYLRSNLIGLDLSAAMGQMTNNLIPHALGLEEARKTAFNMGENNTLDEIQKAQLEKLKTAKERVERRKRIPGWAKNSVLKLNHLQMQIKAYLTYVNYLPGSTVDDADINGKAEGTNRKKLKEFENGGNQYFSILKAAIEGLKDVKNLNTNGKKQIELEFKDMVKTCFPKSYGAVFKGKHRDKLLDPTNKKRNMDKDN